MTEDLSQDRHVQRWQQRRQTARRLFGLPLSLMLCALALAIAMYLIRQPGLQNDWAAWLPLVFAVGFAIWRWRKVSLPHPSGILLAADVHFGLQELLSTSWSLRDSQSPVALHIRHQAQISMNQVGAETLPTPKVAKSRWWQTLAICILLLFAGLAIPPIPKASAQQQQGAEPENAQADQMESLARQMRKTLEDQDKDELLVADGLERLAGDMREGAGPREALLQLDNLESELEKANKQGDPVWKMQEALARGMDSLPEKDRGEASENNQLESPEGLAEAMDNMMSQFQNQNQTTNYQNQIQKDMAQAMKDMANRLDGAQHRKAKKALRDAAKALEKGDLQAAKEALQKVNKKDMARAIQELQSQKNMNATQKECLAMAREGLQYGKLASLEEMEKRMKAGQGKSKGGKGGKGSSLAGKGTTNDATKGKQTGTGKPLNRQGEQVSDWESEHIAQNTAARPQGVKTLTDRIRGQKQMGPIYFQRIQMLGEPGDGPTYAPGTGAGPEGIVPTAVPDGQVPPAYRDTVRDYFQKLRQPKTE